MKIFSVTGGLWRILLCIFCHRKLYFKGVIRGICAKVLRGIFGSKEELRRSQWPHGLRRRSSAASLPRSWVRIPAEAWMFFCYECCVLSGRGLCDGLITRPEESYRLWCVVCEQKTSKMRRLKPATGLWKDTTQWVVMPGKQTNEEEVEIEGRWKW
jgi:hypothetical protein